MQICVPDHVEDKKEEKRSSFFCKNKKLGEIGELSDQLSESESDC